MPQKQEIKYQKKVNNKILNIKKIIIFIFSLFIFFKLNIDECVDFPVIINVPVNLINDIEMLYNSLFIFSENIFSLDNF